MGYANLDDTQLVQLLREAIEGAFVEIYTRYWKLLYTTAYNVTQDEYAAKGVVQDVFLELWRRRNEADILRLKPYLQQAARYRILRLIRSQKTGKQFNNRLVAVIADIIFHRPLLFKEQEFLPGNILATLPDDCGIVFKLSREEQLTYKQIAAELNISEKTVEKKMSTCLAVFREALENNTTAIIFLSLLASPNW